MTGTQPLLPEKDSEEAEMIVASHVEDAEVQFRGVLTSDWSNTLCAAPIAIGILGECMLVSSVKAAKMVTIDNPHLESKRLTTNLLHIFQTGRSAFLEAQVGMATISAYANQVGSPNGVINKIVMRLGRPKTALNEKNLKNDLKSLKSKALNCAIEASNIYESFKKWSKDTDTLWRAVHDKEAENLDAQRKKREEAEELERKKAEAKKAEEDAQHKAAEQKKKRDKAGQLHKEFNEDGVSALNMHAGAAISFINPTLGWGIMGLTMLCSWGVEKNALDAEALYEEQMQRVRDIEFAETKLAKDMEILMSDRSGLVDAEKVLGDAIGRLMDLQDQIQKLLLFFISIVKVVEIVINHYEKDYLPKLEDDVAPENEEEAAELREEILAEAVKVKIHFATIQHIAGAYVELSDKHIVGGFKEIGELGLSDSSITTESRKLKELQLKEYKSRSSASVRETSQRAQLELRGTLKTIVEGSAGGILIKRNGVV
ncbi:uncharacterized protein BDZ99DRAFT_574114 [Mytilinidion resinicola]|uniref:Uncharacterized protein n=1 Tax=Mytilinidion resinicola TaxID=574789 RepID=A0A6A6YCS6_9PEZI|nr:uncharacterized protein BDZ99DRAFT_574114 [Mytilinidion resinicola]KAF2805824.1 hypothetical protein BDZ99DRAFT_574114 [Mytilinidion resinicola]